MKKNGKYNISIKVNKAEKESTSDRFSYQQEAIENMKLMDEAYPDYYSTLVVVPTGGGKTRIAVEYLYENIIGKEGHKVLWIAERLLLLEQAYATFKNLADRGHLPNKKESEVITRLISSRHGDYGDTKFHEDIDLVIITQQTLEKKIERDSKIVKAMKDWLAGAQCLTIVIDEAHHAIAEPYKAILMSLLKLKQEGVFKKCHMIGLTATPKRELNEEIEDIFSFGVLEEEDGELRATSEVSYAYRISIHDLVSREILSIPYMVQVKGEADIDGIILQTYLNGISALHFYNGQTGREYNINTRRIPDSFGQTILFAESRIHALKLEKMFLNAGVECGLAISLDNKFEDIFQKKQESEESLEDYLGISMSEKKKQIRDNIKDYRLGNLPLIITVDMLLEGVDFPQTQTIFIAKKTPDDVDVTQMVGRGLRGKFQGGTPTAFIINFGEERLEKILWEIPDSYSQGRKGDVLNTEYTLSKTPKIQCTNLPLLKAEEFEAGVWGEEEKERILYLEDNTDNPDQRSKKAMLEDKLIQEVISSSTVTLLPCGYCVFGRRVLLVWEGMDIWIDAIRNRIDRLVGNYHIETDRLKTLDSFQLVAREIKKEILECNIWEETNSFFSKDIVERYLWHIIRFYMIQCKESEDTFLQATQLQRFSHLEQYDLSGILLESAVVDSGSMEGFMEESWTKGSEDMHAVWHDKETFMRFLRPKIYRFKQIWIEEEEEEEDDGEYFRVRLFREGRKRDNLCDMLKQIVQYVPDSCNQFVDVFGGTGTVTAQMKGVFEKRAYNDFDVNLANFIYCVSDRKLGKEFVGFCYDRLLDLNKDNKENMIVRGVNEIVKKLQECGLLDRDIQKAYDIPDLEIIIKKKVDSLGTHAEEKSVRLREEYNKGISKCMGKIPLERKREFIQKRQYLLSRYKELTRQKSMLEDGDIKEIIKQYIAFYYITNGETERLSADEAFCGKYRNSLNERKNLKHKEMLMWAFRFLFSRGFKSNRISGTSITGVDADGIVRFNNSLYWKKGKSWLSGLHERMEGVEVWCKDFREILSQYDDRSTVHYLDPPYFLTCQYDEGFPDEFHLDMLEWLRSTECKWVLSCKDKGTNKWEATNWDVRLGENKKIIYAPVTELAEEMPRLDEYFKGFLYPMAEFKPGNLYLGDAGCKNPEGVTVYHADVKEGRKRKDKLYVYKLFGEINSEIMISNIEVKEADRKVLKDRGIQIEEFESYFDGIFKNAR